jgi:hypothetical protein
MNFLVPRVKGRDKPIAPRKGIKKSEKVDEERLPSA